MVELPVLFLRNIDLFHIRRTGKEICLKWKQLSHDKQDESSDKVLITNTIFRFNWIAENFHEFS